MPASVPGQTGRPSPAADDPADGARSVRGGDGCTLVHLSDPHLTNLDGITLRELLNKRLLGYLSWRRKRRHEHRREVLDALVADLRSAAPDQIVITGDLTQLGTPAECSQARHWLEQLGAPQEITLVPGNHDAYVRDDWEATIGQWTPYLRGDGQDTVTADDYPCLRRRGPLALIGINTAWPTAPLLATGRVGAAQLERVRAMLVQTRDEGRCRVLLLHHPVHAAAVSWRKALDDAEALRGILAEHGAELILHGHGHVGARWELPGPGGSRIPVLAAPSASALGQHSRHPAGYLRLRVRRADDATRGWRIDLEERRYDRHRHRFRSQGSIALVGTEPARLG